jgi:hypothetical protein
VADYRCCWIVIHDSSNGRFDCAGEKTISQNAAKADRRQCIENEAKQNLSEDPRENKPERYGYKTDCFENRQARIVSYTVCITICDS